VSSQPRASAGAPFVVVDLEGLEAIARAREFRSRRRLLLEVPGMGAAEAFEVSERLNSARSECGCSLGAKAMTAGFVVVLAALLAAYGPFSIAFLERSPIAVGAAFASAALGKAVGIVLGRRRARHEVTRVLEKFNHLR
jgi:hypothetical protein